MEDLLCFGFVGVRVDRVDDLHVFLLVCGLRKVKDPLYLLNTFSGDITHYIHLISNTVNISDMFIVPTPSSSSALCTYHFLSAELEAL